MTAKKIAIFLSNEILMRTDRLSQETSNSISEIIQDALIKYIQEKEGEQITQQLNNIYEENNNTEDLDFLDAAKTYYTENIVSLSD